jgi:hypothetical protein
MISPSRVGHLSKKQVGKKRMVTQSIFRHQKFESDEGKENQRNQN